MWTLISTWLLRNVVFNARVWVTVGILAVLVYGWHRFSSFYEVKGATQQAQIDGVVLAAVKADFNSRIDAQRKALDTQLRTNQQVTTQLAQTNQLIETQSNEINRLHAEQSAAALRLLSSRPTRPASDSATKPTAGGAASTTATYCGATQLYAEDVQSFVGLARDATIVADDATAVRLRYEALRTAVNTINGNMAAQCAALTADDGPLTVTYCSGLAATTPLSVTP